MTKAKSDNSAKEKKARKTGGATPVPGSEAEVSITSATSEPKARKTRGCLWTLYQYEKHLPLLRTYLGTIATYGVFGYEVCPETGRPHLQGYVHWEHQRSIFEFSKTFGNCHVQIADGSAEQNRNYCLKIRPGDKPNERWEEFGTMPQQGRRTDWKKALEDIKEGKEITSVIEEQPQLLPCQRAIREYKNMLLKPLQRTVNVIVIYGQAGVGKTRYAYDHHPDLYVKPAGQWWDGYTGQKAILLDDFYGWIEYHDLLRVLDRYPYNAPIKGSYVWAQWDTVYITSNKPPAQWYKHGLTPALDRRLNSIMYMYKDENGKTCVAQAPRPSSSQGEASVSEASSPVNYDEYSSD